VVESIETVPEVIPPAAEAEGVQAPVSKPARRKLPSWKPVFRGAAIAMVCISVVVLGIIIGPRLLSGGGEETPDAMELFTEPPSPTEKTKETLEISPIPTEPEVPVVDPSGQTVVFWHVWYSDIVKSGMDALVEDFNATNEWGITVEAYDQGSYSNMEDLMNAAIQSGDLPDLVVAYGNALANWHSVDVIMDMDPYINDPDWGLTAEEKGDFYEAAFNGVVAPDGAWLGFPISQSIEVLFYNYTWGKELGFDAPPTNSAEFKEQACAAAAANAADDDPDNNGTGGYVLYAGASQVSVWWFSYGGYHLTADGAWNFATSEMESIAEFLKDLWDEGCAFSTESYPNPEFATRKALMISSSSVGLPYQEAAFEDAGTDDEWGYIPFPGEAGQAVDSYLQTVGMVPSTPERELAAWLFLKWFTAPEQQAEWIEASAYYPTRASTVPLLEAYAADKPQWSSGLELVPLGQVEPAIASWLSVRRLLQDTFSKIIQGTPDMIPELLAELDEAAAEAMAEME
jgi:ABC-type glycerol-3-phosphate transport system substrate-binding protein